MEERLAHNQLVAGSIPAQPIVLQGSKGAPTQIKVAATDRSSDIPLEARVPDLKRAEGERKAAIPAQPIVLQGSKGAPVALDIPRLPSWQPLQEPALFRFAKKDRIGACLRAHTDLLSSEAQGVCY